MTAPTVRRTGMAICARGANCTCPFAQHEQGQRLPAPTTTTVADISLATEVADWADRGWKIRSSSSREVVLDRTLKFGFCVNLGLCVVTALLWIAYWVPNSRHPRIDTRTISVSDDGEISVARTVRRS